MVAFLILITWDLNDFSAVLAYFCVGGTRWTQNDIGINSVIKLEQNKPYFMYIWIKIQILADFGSNFTSFFKWSTSEMQVYLISEYFDQFSVLNSLFVIFKQIICHIIFSIFEKFTSEISCLLQTRKSSFFYS